MATHRHTAHYGQNVTSSIKPEVRNISQRCQRTTEPLLQGSAQKNSWRSVQRFQRYARGQTDTHTHTQTNWSQYSTPYLGGVISHGSTVFSQLIIAGRKTSREWRNCNNAHADQ